MGERENAMGERERECIDRMYKSYNVSRNTREREREREGAMEEEGTQKELLKKYN